MHTVLQELQSDPTLVDVSALVLKGLENQNTRAMYGKALADFLNWCNTQAGVLPLTRVVVEQHREFLLARGYSTGTINQRLTAIRKLARSAAEVGLLGGEDAAEILRVGGEKRKLIRREDHSLSAAEAQSLLDAPNPKTKKGKRDRALLALLVGCGLRRNEIVQAKAEDILRWKRRWALAHVVGLRDRERTVPLPGWVKRALDAWLRDSQIRAGAIFRALDRDGTVLDRVLSAPMVLTTVAAYGKRIGIRIAPRDLRRTCAKLCRGSGADLEEIQLLLGHANVQATGEYVGSTNGFGEAPNDLLRFRCHSARKRAR